MTRSVVTAFHLYTPDWGQEYYEPILDFYIQTMKKYKDEYDKVYFIDSNWNINPDKLKDLNATILKVNPNLRYYDAYKDVLPQIKEDIVLFTDNDLVIYREGMINYALTKIEGGLADVVSIYDSCGTYKTDKLNGKNKFTPYWFATRKDLLMRYLDVDWGPHLPHSETLGYLTEKMLNDGIRPFEFIEDKNSIYFDGTKDEEKSKDLGYYHIRAGSSSAVLLAWRDHRPETYQDYLKNSPKREYLRQCAWFWYMCGEVATPEYRQSLSCMNSLQPIICEVLGNHENNNCGKTDQVWSEYMEKFRKYHGLK